MGADEAAMEWLATLVYAHFKRILVCECVVQQDLGIGHRAALIPLVGHGRIE
jgi:hypothetical protein